MKKLKMFVVPLLLLSLVSFGWLINELRIKQQQVAYYRLPADTSPRSLLGFMRKMDGSAESPTGILQRFSIDDNKHAICKAVLEASKHIPVSSADLNREEIREALFYKIKYTVKGLEQGHASGTHAEIAAFEADAKDFLSDFKKLSSRELMVASLSLMVFEVKGNLSQNLTFLQWLDDRLSVGDETPEAALLKNRIQRIQYRWQLIDKQLELVSANLSGEPFDIQSLRGKVVYVEFWSTGCPACIAELPALQRIYQNYQAKGFEIVAICVGSEPERIRRFVQGRNLPWVQLCHDPTASKDCNWELFHQFGVEALPTTFLLDASGTVLAQGVRPLHQDSNRNLESILMKLLP